MVPVFMALLPVVFPKQATRTVSALLLLGVSMIGLASIGMFFIPAAIVMGVAACARSESERT